MQTFKRLLLKKIKNKIIFRVMSPERSVGVPAPPGWETWQAAQGHAVCLLHHQRVCQPSQPLSSQPEQTAIYLPQPIWLLSTFSAVASKMEGKKRKGWGGVKRRSSDNESFLRSTQGKMLRPSAVMYALEEARQMLVEDFRWWRYKMAKKKKLQKKKGTAISFASDFTLHWRWIAKN